MCIVRPFIQTPSIPLIDGRGHIWHPRACSSAKLLEYTLGEQVVETFDFTSMIRMSLRHFAPDVIILLGPGSNLGGSLAQVLIQENWNGISSKSDFLAHQKENPFLLAMARSDQRPMVTE